MEIIQGGRRLQDVRKGEPVYLKDEEDIGQLFMVKHHCDPDTWNLNNFEGGLEQVLQEKEPDEDLDLVVFPVGAIGMGYPSNVAFQVHGECMACDKGFDRWFIWRPRSGVGAFPVTR